MVELISSARLARTAPSVYVDWLETITAKMIETMAMETRSSIRVKPELVLKECDIKYVEIEYQTDPGAGDHEGREWNLALYCKSFGIFKKAEIYHQKIGNGDSG